MSHMSELTFYRQKRQDHGVRTGILLNGVTIYGMFEEGSSDFVNDPLGSGIVWFVDVRCKGDRIPDDPEDARRWLMDAEPQISRALAELSERLPLGQDPSDWPFRWIVTGSPEGTTIEIVWSCTRSTVAREISEAFEEIRSHWIRRLEQLTPNLTVH